MTEQPPQQPWQPPQQGQPAPGQPGYSLPTGYRPEPPATGKAITALILGIVGLTMCVGVASIPAWIIGDQAVKEIDGSQGALGGRTLAFAGKVMGIVGTALAGLALIGVILLFAIGGLFFNAVEDCVQNGTYTSDTLEC